MQTTHFERAVFLSWYCAKGDCKFCYMSTQKERIKDPIKARRTIASILAEAIICKACGWKIEFLSGGYRAFSIQEIKEIVKQVSEIMEEKQWLNIGILSKKEIEELLPYTKGICGTIECINPKLQKELCPSKPIEETTKMLKSCKELGLKKAITIIIGLGESFEDIKLLKEFIKENKIDRVTFYALNPHPGTQFKQGPKTSDYIKWISEIRQEFPEIEIVAGSWVNRLAEISHLLDAGADSITKFPSIKLFGTKYAQQIEEQAKKANRTFKGTLTKLPDIDWDKEVDKIDIDAKLKQQLKQKLNQYITAMKKNINKAK
ncbi:MAG: radical SAM protein [Candidatus Woesearchaeota archaeon]